MKHLIRLRRELGSKAAWWWLEGSCSLVFRRRKLEFEHCCNFSLYGGPLRQDGKLFTSPDAMTLLYIGLTTISLEINRVSLHDFFFKKKFYHTIFKLIINWFLYCYPNNYDSNVLRVTILAASPIYLLLFLHIRHLQISSEVTFNLSCLGVGVYIVSLSSVNHRCSLPGTVYFRQLSICISQEFNPPRRITQKGGSLSR